MTKTKSNRVFLGLVTCAMALAGTGLTIANNWKNELQVAAIALTLAACFSAAEITFLWGHKRYETTKKLWRKIVLAVSLGLLVCSMGYAVSEELKLALHKVSSGTLAENSAKLVSGADKTNQRSIARSALNMLGANKVEANSLPFVICYILTGLVSIAILAVSEVPAPRTRGAGNLLPSRPDLADRVRDAGYDPATSKVYALNKGGGYAIHTREGYKGHIPSDKNDNPNKWIL